MPKRDEIIYFLDSSALIAMQNELWPMKHFPVVWANINDLADAGRLLVFEAVKDECDDEELVRWFVEHPNVLIGPSSEIENCMKRLMQDLQSRKRKLVDYESRESDADSFVIACAMAHNLIDSGSFASGRYVLVQHEGSARSSPTRVKIPDVCDWYGIKYMKALNIVKEENWIFCDTKGL